MQVSWYNESTGQGDNSLRSIVLASFKKGTTMFNPKIQKLIKDQMAADDHLPAYAWPGGYPLFYMDEENNVLCPRCAFKDKDDEYRIITDYEINWEDSTLYCEECNDLIESAYGTDDEEEQTAEWNDMHMAEDD